MLSIHIKNMHQQNYHLSSTYICKCRQWRKKICITWAVDNAAVDKETTALEKSGDRQR